MFKIWSVLSYYCVYYVNLTFTLLVLQGEKSEREYPASPESSRNSYDMLKEWVGTGAGSCTSKVEGTSYINDISFLLLVSVSLQLQSCHLQRISLWPSWVEECADLLGETSYHWTTAGVFLTDFY